MMDPEEAARIEARLTVLEQATAIDHAHVENLIERVYDLEMTVEAVLVRLAAVERATPWKKPGKPPQRPVR